MGQIPGGYIGEAVGAVIVTAERQFFPIFLPSIGKRQEPGHTVLVFIIFQDSLHSYIFIYVYLYIFYTDLPGPCM